MNKVALLILDGWGIGEKNETNAIFKAKTPFVDSLRSYPNSQIYTHGEHVGLPEGQMGNSEVGHINIGAGRIVYQELARINKSISSGEIENESSFQRFLKAAKGNKVHLLGLVSDGGVHSHIDHFTGVLPILKKHGLDRVFVHAFTDGRDTDPQSGLSFIEELDEHCKENGAVIASVVGRYYAMDRDKRWERTMLAYNLLVNGEGKKTTKVLEAIQASYDEEVTDEFILPIVRVNAVNEPVAEIEEGDCVLFMNFRTDRPRQLTSALTQIAQPEYGMQPLDLAFFTMSKYDNTFQKLDIIFDKQNVEMPLGEVLANSGKTQIRIAETEKYPHVTFFFNGGREVEFSGETRILVNSPKVATYDLQPEMSAYEITSKIKAEIDQQTADFICLNFANADMVGHTGDFDAAIKAAETVDDCVKQIVELGLDRGYDFLVTADHGNSDMMVNGDGSPNTAHTTNPVPLFYVSKDGQHTALQDGILADLAPTILHLLNVEIPALMTGKVLVE